MLRRWAGPLVTLLIGGGVALILALNLNVNTSRDRAPSRPSPAPAAPEGEGAATTRSALKPAGFREYPIGDEVLKNHLRIAAVWLPPILMGGSQPPQGSSGAGAGPGNDVIHLEADIHATEGNPNGFAKDEFVPYLKIRYTIAPAAGGAPIHQGELMPMVARDGLHYGASVSMPTAGSYRLTYAIEPPSAGGLGRHADPVTGVAPWWGPFEVSFDWDYPGPPG